MGFPHFIFWLRCIGYFFAFLKVLFKKVSLRRRQTFFKIDFQSYWPFHFSIKRRRWVCAPTRATINSENFWLFFRSKNLRKIPKILNWVTLKLRRNFSYCTLFTFKHHVTWRLICIQFFLHFFAPKWNFSDPKTAVFSLSPPPGLPFGPIKQLVLQKLADTHTSSIKRQTNQPTTHSFISKRDLWGRSAAKVPSFLIEEGAFTLQQTFSMRERCVHTPNIFYCAV